jgi:hypothetical protein
MAALTIIQHIDEFCMEYLLDVLHNNETLFLVKLIMYKKPNICYIRNARSAKTNNQS